MSTYTMALGIVEHCPKHSNVKEFASWLVFARHYETEFEGKEAQELRETKEKIISVGKPVGIKMGVLTKRSSITLPFGSVITNGNSPKNQSTQTLPKTTTLTTQQNVGLSFFTTGKPAISPPNPMGVVVTKRFLPTNLAALGKHTNPAANVMLSTIKRQRTGKRLKSPF